LVRQSARLRALVPYKNRGTYGWLEGSSLELRRSIAIVQGDLRDPDIVDRVATVCQYVFHLGAVISIPYSYIAPIDVTRVNVGGRQKIFNACRRYGMQRLVHTSSSELSGTAQCVPIDAAYPLQAQSAYSATKIAADTLVENYSRFRDVPAVTLCLFNLCAPAIRPGGDSDDQRRTALGQEYSQTRLAHTYPRFHLRD